MKKILFFFLLFAFSAQAKTIDLTHPFNDKTIYWPTAKGFELNHVFAGLTKGGFFYSGNTFSTPEHGGTHMDAPYHFNKNGWTVEKIPVDHLIGSAVVIDVTEQVKKDKDYQISKEDIVLWEKTNGPINKGEIVFFHTGFDQFWGDKLKYMGSDVFGDTEHLHFPGISKEAAQYLVSKKISGVGLDTASLDHGPSKEFWAHRVLLGAQIFGLENVDNLGELPARGAKVIVAPMKIEGGTGAPVRILAEVE